MTVLNGLNNEAILMTYEVQILDVMVGMIIGMVLMMFLHWLSIGCTDECHHKKKK